MPIRPRLDKVVKKIINVIRRLSIVSLSLSFRKYRNPLKPSLGSVNSVLIISHFPVGDLVLTSPLWGTLKQRKPQLRIGIGASSSNANVLLCEPVACIYDFYSPGMFRLYKELRRARKDGWDVVLATAGFYKPTRFAFISRYTTKGITATMHSSRSERYAKIYSFCFKRPAPSECVPMTEQYQMLVEETFGITLAANERMPHFHVDSTAKSDTEQRLNAILTSKGYSRFIVVHLEAKNEYREWGIDNVLALAQRLAAEQKDVLLLATASHEYLMYYCPAERLTTANLCVFETTTIHEWAAVAARSALVIAPDTAVVHIAAALEKKLITFYPTRDEWLPYSRNAIVIYPRRWEPIATIGVDTVIEALRAFL